MSESNIQKLENIANVQIIATMTTDQYASLSAIILDWCLKHPNAPEMIEHVQSISFIRTR